MSRIQAGEGRRPIRDITGQRFGRLVAETREFREGVSYWTCRCDCGNFTEATLGNLTSGKVRSCGCILAELRAAGGSNRKHGASGTALYSRWSNLKRTRGVAPEWQDFARFVADIGGVPSGRPILIAPDPSRPLGPDNFRWGTFMERFATGSSNQRLLTFNGVTKSYAAWARDLGITREALRRRIDIEGWSLERALTTKNLSEAGHGACPIKCFLTIDGVTKPVATWARELGVSYQTLYTRWRLQEAERRGREQRERGLTQGLTQEAPDAQSPREHSE